MINPLINDEQAKRINPLFGLSATIKAKCGEPCNREGCKRKIARYASAGLCDACYKKQRRQLNPALMKKQLAQQRLKNTGVSSEQFDIQFQKQRKRCSICLSRKPNGKGWHADHDHKTGKFRGILCAQCNTGLGMLKDDVKLLRKAARYLVKNGNKDGIQPESKDDTTVSS